MGRGSDSVGRGSRPAASAGANSVASLCLPRTARCPPSGRERPRRTRQMRSFGSTCDHVRPSAHSALDLGGPTPDGPMGAESDDRKRPVRPRPRTPGVSVRPLRRAPEPVGSRRCDVSVRLCDRCGDITLDGEGCTCTTPYNLSEVGRRHRAAVESARSTAGRGRVGSGAHRATAASTTAYPAGPRSPAEDRAGPRRTAAAAVPGERAQARLPGRDATCGPGSGAAEARTDAPAPAPHEHRPAPDPDWLGAAEQAPISTDNHHRRGRRR